MAYEKIAEQIASRLPATAPDILATHVKTALGVASRFQEAAQKIKGDHRLSNHGRRDALRDAMVKSREHLTELRGIANKGVDGVRAQRAQIGFKALDRADIFGELRRQEVRTWLRSIPMEERMQVALTSNDPTVREAIQTAPAAMSGLKPEMREQVLTTWLEQEHGPRLRALEETEEAYLVLERAVQTAEEFARQDAGELE